MKRVSYDWRLSLVVTVSIFSAEEMDVLATLRDAEEFRYIIV